MSAALRSHPCRGLGKTVEIRFADAAHVDIMASNTRSRPGRPEGGEATGLSALYAYLHERYA